VIDAKPLPLATKRITAEQRRVRGLAARAAFARTVEPTTRVPFQAFLHAGTVFTPARPDADRGSAEVAKSWAEIVEGKTIALRWRPGIVQIGGEPTIAISRGPYILQRMQAGRADSTASACTRPSGCATARRRLARPLRRQRDDRPADGRPRCGRALGRGTGDVRLRLVARRPRTQALITPPLSIPRSALPRAV
jgi:hypothetical protein